VKNPIPRNDESDTGKGFAPHCPNPTDKKLGCQGMTNGNNANAQLEIVDHVSSACSPPPSGFRAVLRLLFQRRLWVVVRRS
jgi:hypothetical protein